VAVFRPKPAKIKKNANFFRVAIGANGETLYLCTRKTTRNKTFFENLLQ
jgi:hypothetical protein